MKFEPIKELNLNPFERTNRTSRHKIRVNCNSDWDDELPLFLMNLPHSQTSKNGISPSEILYGRKLKLQVHHLNKPQKFSSIIKKLKKHELSNNNRVKRNYESNDPINSKS
ncbi:hypothetical protein A3Q56_07025 [Intoshia linei]|uniref:Uncharacterized protein n=1 Tax=Intoshia linei TaxID=1819745 RepID=A0A177ATW6_9BILA|nr:hypothetical protein A3Q56_07025 [Intoshia linei]